MAQLSTGVPEGKASSLTAVLLLLPTIHPHGSPPRAHPVPGRGSAGPGRSPGRFFHHLMAFSKRNLRTTRAGSTSAPPLFVAAAATLVEARRRRSRSPRLGVPSMPLPVSRKIAKRTLSREKTCFTSTAPEETTRLKTNPTKPPMKPPTKPPIEPPTKPPIEPPIDKPIRSPIEPPIPPVKVAGASCY
eukprot:scaffold12525_cov91-Phaeocystis_antarctica.AAC.1